MKELPDNYIPHKAEDFEVSVGIDGNIRYKDKSGMTDRARRTGGPLIAILKAIIVFCLVGFVAMFVMLSIPDGLPQANADTIIWTCLVGMVAAPTITLLLHLRRKWLRWSLIGFVGFVVVGSVLMELINHLIILTLN